MKASAREEGSKPVGVGQLTRAEAAEGTGRSLEGTKQQRGSRALWKPRVQPQERVGRRRNWRKNEGAMTVGGERKFNLKDLESTGQSPSNAILETINKVSHTHWYEKIGFLKCFLLLLLKPGTSGTKITKWAPWRKHCFSTIAGYYSSCSERSDDVLDTLTVPWGPGKRGHSSVPCSLEGLAYHRLTQTRLSKNTQRPLSLGMQSSVPVQNTQTHKHLPSRLIPFRPQEGILYNSGSMTSKQKVPTPELCESLWVIPL